MKKNLNNIKSKGSDIGISLAKYVIQHKWMVIIVSFSILAMAAYGAKYVALNSDYRVFFSKKNPQLLAYDALQNKYTKDDNVYVAFEPQNGNVFTSTFLAAIEEFVEIAWQTPYSTRVDAITNFQFTRSIGDDLYVEDLISDAKILSSHELNEIKHIATTDPRIKNRLVNERGSITAINITVKIPDNGDPKNNEKVVNYIKEQVVKFQEVYPNINVYTSGMVMFTNAFMEASFKDMTKLSPLMFLVILITTFLFTRTISGTLATLVVIVASIVSAMGIGGWLGISITTPSSAFMNIVMTLAVADSIHIIISLVQNMKKGMGKTDAIIESLRINFLPVFLTSLTTVIGFLSMNLSDSPPFRDLGNLTAIGMTAAFFFSVVTMPALLTILPVKIKSSSHNITNRMYLMEMISEFVINNRRAIIFGGVTLTIVSSTFIFKNELNDEFIKYFSKDVDFRNNTDYISENLTGIYTIEFSLGSGEPGGINNPEYLKKLEEFEDFLYSHNEVIHVNSFTEVSRQINKSMHGDNIEYYRLPDIREQAAQFLLLYEMSLPFGLDLNNQVNVDKSETRMIVTVKNISTKKMLALEKNAQDWLKANAPEHMHAEGVSSTMMFSHLTQRQIKSMIKGTILALILISSVLSIAIKSVRYGFLSLIPNIIPILIGLGIWGIMVGYINTGISIVFGMTLGIIVDDTVHFLMKYLRARRELKMNAEDAVRYSFNTVGKALMVTTFVLIMGFFVIVQSDFGMNSGMAKITMIIIALALIIDFLFLPSLLLTMANQSKQTLINLKTASNEAA